MNGLLKIYLILACFELSVYGWFWFAGKVHAKNKEQMRAWMLVPKYFVFTTTPILIIELPILYYLNVI